ncbi:cytochrome c1, partial [Pseudomonadota bacterium]
ESPGTLSKDEFDVVVKDLTNFMVYLGEPVRMVRTKIGIYVLLFLAVLLVLTYLLKKEYWKDVH